MKTALVAEGGGMRGIFGAGVLDAFHSAGFDPFDMYVGVSAGACNLSSFIAGQFERNYRLYTNIMVRPDFISWKKFLSGGHFMDLDWFWDTFKQEDPMDLWAAVSHIQNKTFLVVCSVLATGQAVYLEPTAGNWLDLLKASCALPVLYRNSCDIDGQKLLDGGVIDPIPVAEAYRRGARKIVVIRSQPAAYVKKSGWEDWIVSLVFRGQMNFVYAIQKRAERYMQVVEFMNQPPKDTTIIQVLPPQTLQTRRTSQDLDALKADYAMGLAQGELAMARFQG
jgi:predicted patatin/cPLA2 family phospholipase